MIAQLSVSSLRKAGHVGPGALLPKKIVENFPHFCHVACECGGQMDASVGTPMHSGEANGYSCGHFLVIGEIDTAHVIDRGAAVPSGGVRVPRTTYNRDTLFIPW